MANDLFVWEHLISEEVDMLLMDYLIQYFPEIASSKSKYKKHISRQLLYVNGEKAFFSKTVSKSDRIAIKVFEYEKPVLELETDVLFEDEYLAVVLKPSGIITSGNQFNTFENCLAYNLSKSSEKDSLRYPLVCHRLDYATSGLVLVAKTTSALKFYKFAFENNKILKEYHAIIVGAPRNSFFSIQSPIDAKNALTNVFVLKTVNSIHFGQLSLVKIDLKTGRKHQIRRHLSSIDYPILGDQIYAKPIQRLRGKGMFLFSSKIVFKHFKTNKNIEIEAQLPNKYEKILDRQKLMFEKKMKG